MFEMLQFWSNVSGCTQWKEGKGAGCSGAGWGAGCFVLVWKWGSINLGGAPPTCRLPSHTGPESHRQTPRFALAGVCHCRVHISIGDSEQRARAGTLRTFGGTSVPALPSSKVERKKHRRPQGDKQTKGRLFKFEIHLEIKVGFTKSKTLSPRAVCPEKPRKQQTVASVLAALKPEPPGCGNGEQ